MTTPVFIPESLPSTVPEATYYWFAFRGDHLLVQHSSVGTAIPHSADFSHQTGLLPIRQHYIGRINTIHCYALAVDEYGEVPSDMSFHQLRSLFSRLPDDWLVIAGRALQIVQWDRDHQFCGRCATQMEQTTAERVKCCPACGLKNYPRISPAVIMRVTRGAEILLSRSPHFSPGRYSIQAGFVEPGESLEEAVARELMEEVSLRVKNIRYFSSQPWPFPNSLMMAFTAEYASGELQVDHEELEDAYWWHPQQSASPELPPYQSIARHLIEDFLQTKV